MYMSELKSIEIRIPFIFNMFYANIFHILIKNWLSIGKDFISY